MIKQWRVFFVCICILRPMHLEAWQGATIPLSEYTHRRAAILSKLEPGTAAIFCSAEQMMRNDDVPYPYRQNSTFLYLTGIHEQRAVLLLISDGMYTRDSLLVHSILFLTRGGFTWTGEIPSLEERRIRYGFTQLTDLVLPYDTLQTILSTVLPSIRVLYYTPSLPETFIDRVANIPYISWREAKKHLQERFPNLEVRSSNELVQQLRIIKSYNELQCLQEAVNRTIEALSQVMKSTREGIYEYELEMILEQSLMQHGSRSQAYSPIIACGKNALYPHYETKTSKLKKGSLVLVDCGAEVHGYGADITRTFPVSGKFTPVQRKLYNVVLAARDSGIAAVEIGTTLHAIHTVMERVLIQGICKLGITTTPDEAKKLILHEFCHFVGLDVHDVGSSKQPLEVGMVLALEPALYIPDSLQYPAEYRGIGIRLEDNVVVTENGCTMLSALAPVTIEEIEDTMKRDGATSKEKSKLQ
ncbi:MAG: aminopeptidase P N-terminal domain-containing protein [Bacteroidetes bacterium]|nr:aminopeptidase P N-terminal domain-containing protein [Bacteroidota bacterium]